jgi:hypothetical protein
MGGPWLRIAFALAVALGGEAALATSIDQDTTGNPGPDLWVDDDARIAQLFTVGQDGVLATLELELTFSPLSPGSSFALHVVGSGFDPVTNPNALVGSALATAQLGTQPATGVLVIDFSGLGLAFSAGTQLVFVISTGNVLAFAGAHSYAGGAAFYQCTFDTCVDPLGLSNPEVDAGAFVEVSDSDLGPLSFAFRTTLVPEPSRALLIAAALLALRGRARPR